MINSGEHLERTLAAVLHDDAPARAPDKLRKRVLTLSANRVQRGRWLPIAWLPQRMRSPLLASVGLLLVAILASVGLVVIVALTRDSRPSPNPSPVPSPSSREPIVAGPWRGGSSPDVARSEVLGWHDGRVLVAASLTDDPREPGRLLDYDPGGNRWTDHGEIDYRVWQVGSSAAIVDGQAYLFGELPESAAGRAMVWTLDLGTRATTFDADVSFASTNSVTASRPDQMIYVLDLGGQQDSGAIAPGSLRLYDPRAGVWQDLPAMPTPRAEGRLAVDALGRAYVLGGWTDGDCIEPEPSVTSCRTEPALTIDRFDPGADAWEVIGQLPSPISEREFETGGMTPVVAADAKLYIARLVDPVVGPGVPFELWRVRVERFDLNTREWSAFGELPNSGAMSLVGSADGWLIALGEDQWAAGGDLNIPVWTTRLPGF